VKRCFVGRQISGRGSPLRGVTTPARWWAHMTNCAARLQKAAGDPGSRPGLHLVAEGSLGPNVPTLTGEVLTANRGRYGYALLALPMRQRLASVRLTLLWKRPGARQQSLRP
jgi:hypothetical protein